MDYEGLSRNGLLELHTAILKALVTDDNAAAVNEPKPYGVREYADWKEMADGLEGAMKKKGMRFGIPPVPRAIRLGALG